VEKSGGASLSYAGDMEEKGAARVWEGVAGHSRGAASLWSWGGRPPPLAPHYIGGSQVLVSKSSNKTRNQNLP
jgi:hypothetical protein